MLLVLEVLWPLPAVLTVFSLLLSSFTIVLPVLNVVTWFSLLQKVLLHFLPRSAYKTFLSNYFFTLPTLFHSFSKFSNFSNTFYYS